MGKQTACPKVTVGSAVFVQTVTFGYTGRVVAQADGMLWLTDAAWIAETGRFTQAMASGEFDEVEPYPEGQVVALAVGAIVTIMPWVHKLPRARRSPRCSMTKKMLVRVSDNVLNEKEWPVHEVTLGIVATRGVGRLGVVDQVEVKSGCYTIPPMRGWLFEELAEWSREDPTGRHPETYNEIAMAPGRDEKPKFKPFWPSEKLRTELLYSLLA